MSLGVRLTDSVQALGDGLVGIFKALRRGLAQGGAEIARGVRLLAAGQRPGLTHVGAGIGGMTSALLSVFIGVCSGCLQAVRDLFLVAPSRPLYATEIAGLRTVFGNSVDYKIVRVRALRRATGNPAAGKAHCNSVYIRSDMIKNGVVDLPLLVHQVAHVWQHQVGCNDLFARGLFERLKAGGDEAWTRDLPTTSFERLTTEQQAMLLEAAYRFGFFDPKSPRYDSFHHDLSGAGVATDLTRYVRAAVRYLHAQ